MSSEKNVNLEPGSVIAKRYTVEKCLGSGGMGAVYLAQDSFLNGDRVAIKILHPDLVIDAKQSQRFMREVQLMRKVDHSNVVRTYDVGSDGDIVFFTMEYVSGKSLEAFIEGQSFPKDQISKLIIGVCSGLEAIHKASIIHRDLKPANILILEDFQPKITDFGVARPEYSELTAHNEIIGSALYIAPEVWLGTKLTSSVDLYSFGVVLYELTTGVLPFDGDSPAALMRMHLEFKPTPPKELNPEIPVWLNKLILNLLSKTAEERMRDAADVIDYVEAQVNSGKRRTASEDNFINDLEAAASQFDSGIEKSPALNAKAVEISYGGLGEKTSRTFGQEILATAICMLIGGVLFLGLNTFLGFIRHKAFTDLENGISDPSKWTYQTLAELPLSAGYLFLLALQIIVCGGGLFIPLGAATGSLKNLLRIFVLGLLSSSILIFCYLVFGLTNSSEKNLLLSQPDGFTLVLSSLRMALAGMTVEPEIWSIQKIVFEEGPVYYPEVINPLSSKLNLLFQAVPFIALSLLTTALAKMKYWKISGVILGVATLTLYYLAGGTSSAFLKHSNPGALAFIMLIYSGIIFFLRLFRQQSSQRK